MSSVIFRSLATFVDVVHALAMLVWGLGLPLLVWHGSVRLSRIYMWYSVAFVLLTVASHQLLGECFLTTWARALWDRSGDARDDVAFSVLLVNAVAGIRPSSRSAVLIWEAAVLASSAGSLWCWYATHPKRRGRAASH